MAGQLTNKLKDSFAEGEEYKKIYAGFWKRFLAGIIDFIVLLPFAFLSFFFFAAESKTWFVIWIIPSTLLFCFYNVYFHGRWGKTIGKMAVKIRVVLVDGRPIQWKNAFLRFSVDMVLGILMTILYMKTLVAFPAGEWASLSFTDKSLRISELLRPYKWLEYIQVAWVYSELFVLLFNKKKRAIHDFIAGTVVVHEAVLEKGQKGGPHFRG